MTVTKGIVGDDADAKILGVIGELDPDLDPDRCAYILIVIDLDKHEKKMYANTSNPDQIIALMHITLVSLTSEKLWPGMNLIVDSAPPGQGRHYPAG